MHCWPEFSNVPVSCPLDDTLKYSDVPRGTPALHCERNECESDFTIQRYGTPDVVLRYMIVVDLIWATSSSSTPLLWRVNWKGLGRKLHDPIEVLLRNLEILRKPREYQSG